MKNVYLKELETCILYFLYSGLQVDEAELLAIICINVGNIYDEHLIKIYRLVTERFLTNQYPKPYNGRHILVEYGYAYCKSRHIPFTQIIKYYIQNFTVETGESIS
jgi:hypothetical protein